MSRISRREFAALTAGGLLAQPGPLTARQVVARIQRMMGVEWNPKTYRDTFKAGNPDTPVKGIASTFMCTLDVLQRAAARGRNFVITHEPTFWSDADKTDTLTGDPLFRFKTDFVEKNRMIVWRSHDHWHLRKPDGIFAGWNKALGWERYVSVDDPRIYNLPPTTLDAVARHMARRLETRSIRVVGDPKLQVAKVGRGSHALDANMAMLPRVDLILVSEARERETIEYVRDTVAAGFPKGMILISHEAGEEAGMDEFAAWLRTIVTEVPVEFIPTKDAFRIVS
jgi:putative NIF3 family GTP cyclohydrolase 1 type 2